MTTEEDIGLNAEDVPVAGGGLDALITAYADARTAREQADDRAKRLRDTEAKVEAALFDEMEKLNLRSVRHARGLFMLDDKAWATVLDESALRAWCEREMPEVLLPNMTRLAVIVRQALKGERDEMPPGVEPRFSRKLNWRRS